MPWLLQAGKSEDFRNRITARVYSALTGLVPLWNVTLRALRRAGKDAREFERLMLLAFSGPSGDDLLELLFDEVSSAQKKFGLIDWKAIHEALQEETERETTPEPARGEVPRASYRMTTSPQENIERAGYALYDAFRTLNQAEDAVLSLRERGHPDTGAAVEVLVRNRGEEERFPFEVYMRSSAGRVPSAPGEVKSVPIATEEQYSSAIETALERFNAEADPERKRELGKRLEMLLREGGRKIEAQKDGEVWNLPWGPVHIPERVLKSITDSRRPVTTNQLMQTLESTIVKHVVPALSEKFQVAGLPPGLEEAATMGVLGQLRWSLELLPGSVLAGYVPPDRIIIDPSTLRWAVYGDVSEDRLGDVFAHELEHWFQQQVQLFPSKKQMDVEREKYPWIERTFEQAAIIPELAARLKRGETPESILRGAKPGTLDHMRWMLEVAKDVDPQTVLGRRK